MTACTVEYVKVPVDKVVEIPAGLSLKLGAFIEPVAVGVHAVRRSGYKPGDTAVVYGAGPDRSVRGFVPEVFRWPPMSYLSKPIRTVLKRPVETRFLDDRCFHEDIVKAGMAELTGGLCADFASTVRHIRVCRPR